MQTALFPLDAPLSLPGVTAALEEGDGRVSRGDGVGVDVGMAALGDGVAVRVAKGEELGIAL